MNQRQLFRTIETAASSSFKDDLELLSTVVNKLTDTTDTKISGGRIWQLDSENSGYKLLYQTGRVQKIKKGFFLDVKDYPIFTEIFKQRTILADETNHILKEKGIFRYSASGVGSKINIGGNTFYEYLIAVNSDNVDEELRDTLNVVATVLTSKIKERRLSAARKSLIADIDKAKELQKSILPGHEYRFHFYDLFGITVPADIIGGDFFDYLKVGDDEERVGVTVGDAASKGLAAAAEAMYISGAIRMASTFQIKISLFMRRINELVNKIFSDDKFTTLFYGELSQDRKGLFLYANAGHPPPIFIKAKTKEISYLQSTGPLLGPAPSSKYETDHINFNDGDVLVIYSDGVVESANAKFEFYEEKRLIKKLLSVHHKTPKEIALAILEDVIKFSTPNSMYQDDKTLVVIKRKD
ncbi:MAG: PP2C family protein-serine/threonine phosphatase [bacterium]